MHSSCAALSFVATCLPLLAQQRPENPQVVKLQSLPVSTQGKAAEAVDIALSVVHAPAGGVKCEKGSCDAAEHWQAEVRLGAKADEPPKTFAVSATEELKEHLEWAASPKARTKHTDRVNLSDAKLSIGVPPAAPWKLVQGLIKCAAQAGIHEIGFAVVVAPATPELRLAVPLPMDTGAAVVVDGPKAALEEIRVAMFHDAANNQTIRQFGKNVIRDDEQLRGLIREVHADRVKMGKPSPVILDAAAGVPWQSVVGVIDACHAEGVAVQFAANPRKK